MAELAVLSVAAKILSTIASPAFKKAYEKARSIKDAREELGELGDTLETIRAVLLDAEKKERDSDAIRNWIKRLKRVLYDAEDLFDEVATDDLLKQQTKKLPFKDQVRAFCSNSQISRNSIAEKVKAIRKSLLGLSTDMVQFGFVMGGHNERLTRRERDSGWVIDAKNVIGRDEDKRIILKMLFDVSDDPLAVITIVGIGGMGKTAMAKLLYDDEETKQKFQERWFTCISDTSDEREVLGKIFRSISGKSYWNDLDIGQLIESIRKNIDGRKYLLVLDDVWEDQRSKWVERMSLLSCGAKGSRIIVTTRLSSVKKAVGAGGTHTLKGLSDDDSWKLFKRLAFGAECEMDPRKERLGREIMKRCHGVPLAIQSLGNLLGQEESLSKWEAIEENGFQKLGGDYNEIMSVLKLSYDHLPSNIKQCFAYCSLFPKDDKLFKEDLINHWIAQGYIEPNDGESVFMYLLRMIFFQEVEKDYHGEIRSCKMHDIMHDLALYVAGEESVVLSGILANNTSNCARHVSVVNNEIDESFGNLTSMPNVKLLRSLMLRRRDMGWVRSSDAFHVFARFKYLRTLSLAYRNIDNVPNSIGELKLMRYLDLKHTGITKLPYTIANLVNLLSLDLECCFNFRVWPLDFHKLVNLRYLNVTGCRDLKYMPLGIAGMTNLQHLSDFVAKDALNAPDGLPQQLRGKLSIRVGSKSGASVQSWQVPVHLQHLELFYEGADTKLPDWVTNCNGSTNNLVRLELDRCENLKCLSSLRFLPNLRRLQLLNLRELEFMEEEEEGKNTAHNNNVATSNFFPHLEELELFHLPKLKGWWRKEAAMEVMSSPSSGFLEFPLLHELTVRFCPDLDFKSFPPCPALRVLQLDGYYVEMARGREATSSNPLSLCPKLSTSFQCPEEVSIVKSHILEILQLASAHLHNIRIYKNSDELMSIKLVVAHRLDFSWIKRRVYQKRIDLVEEAQMPAPSLTVLVLKGHVSYQISKSSTHYIHSNHICSIMLRPKLRVEELPQRLLLATEEELQMVSEPIFTDDSQTVLRTYFELLF